MGRQKHSRGGKCAAKCTSKCLKSLSHGLMGIGKKVAIDLKIANTMQLEGIWVALFEMSGPCVSPSLVMKKTSKIFRAPRYHRQMEVNVSANTRDQITPLLIARRALFML